MQPTLEPVPKESPVVETAGTRTVRIAYALEFLLATIMVFVAWGQIGGQNHLDIMPWFWKLGLGAGVALAVVKVTQAAVGQDHVWSRGTAAWSLLLLLFLIGMGLATYYYHLHENDEDLLEDDVRIEKTLLHSKLRQGPDHA